MSYIFRKLEPLGTDFKTVAGFVTGYLIFLDIKRVEEGMKSSRYNLELGSTAACTKILMDDMKGMYHRDL